MRKFNEERGLKKYYIGVLLIIIMIMIPLNGCSSKEVDPMPAWKNGEWGYINSSGKFVIEPFATDDIIFFSEGMAVKKGENGLYGYIDKNGEFVIAPQYVSAEPFSDGMALVKYGEDYLNGFINTEGEYVIQPQLYLDFRSGEFDAKGLVVASPDDGIYGCMNKQGEWVIEPRFDDMWEFSEDGLALIASYEGNDQKYGYINTLGEIVIGTKFNDAIGFSEGLAAVRIKDKYGFIDTQGNIKIEPCFDYVVAGFDKNTGLAPAGIDGRYGYIDKTGEWAIAPEFRYTEPFFNGYARVITTDGSDALINEKGEFVLAPQKFDTISIGTDDKNGYIYFVCLQYDDFDDIERCCVYLGEELLIYDSDKND